MTNDYILQDRNYGLGNFINLTPTIKSIYYFLGYPVPVYFDLPHVRDCFLDCEFIKILKDKPRYEPLFSSGLINYQNDAPDWVNVYREVSKLFPIGSEIPHTYVDTAKEIPKHGRYTLFMYGSGNEDKIYLSKKTPAKQYYADYMKGDCIFTGSTVDYNRVDWFNMKYYLDDIRKSLALIRDAELVVSNDTGLAHAAGAMNKNMIILWKNTLLPKNGNPGKNTLIKMVR